MDNELEIKVRQMHWENAKGSLATVLSILTQDKEEFRKLAYDFIRNVENILDNE